MSGSREPTRSRTKQKNIRSAVRFRSTRHSPAATVLPLHPGWQLDFTIVQAGVFLLAIIIVSVNFLVDVLYVYLNPTVRLR